MPVEPYGMQGQHVHCMMMLNEPLNENPGRWSAIQGRAHIVTQLLNRDDRLIFC